MKNELTTKQLQEEILITTKHDDFRDLLLIKETKSDGEIWFKVPNSISSPNIDLVIEDLKNQTVKIENSCDEDEKAILNHFRNFIKEIAEYFLKNGVVITQENIHLYYEFMNNEQVCKIGSTKIFLSKLHDNRHEKIIQLLNIDVKILCDFRKTCIHSYYFGVKDTMKPIDEYIADIKDSNDYKQYRFNYLVETYDLSTSHLEKLEHTLFADDSSYVSNIDNLIYAALDNVADDFKMNVINYIEENYLQEETGINCISDIPVIIKDGEFQGLFKEFESYGLNDFSVQNITMFIDRYREIKALDENKTCIEKAL